MKIKISDYLNDDWFDWGQVYLEFEEDVRSTDLAHSLIELLSPEYHIRFVEHQQLYFPVVNHYLVVEFPGWQAAHHLPHTFDREVFVAAYNAAGDAHMKVVEKLEAQLRAAIPEADFVRGLVIADY